MKVFCSILFDRQWSMSICTIRFGFVVDHGVFDDQTLPLAGDFHHGWMAVKAENACII